MKTVVFGANGFLGCAVCRRLPNAIGLSRADCDLTNGTELVALLEHHQPEVIINCAVIADFGNPGIAALSVVNVQAPEMMAAWCKTRNAWLIQPSAAIVHGARFAVAKHRTPFNLDTDYGRSKYDADESIERTGCRATIIRFGGIYGFDGPTHLGLNRAISGAIKGIAPTIIGRGFACRNYICVDDAANLIAHVIETNRHGVIYAGGDEILTIADMIEIVSRSFGTGPPIFAEGDDPSHSIVVSSPKLPATRPMADYLAPHLYT